MIIELLNWLGTRAVVGLGLFQVQYLIHDLTNLCTLDIEVEVHTERR